MQTLSNKRWRKARKMTQEAPKRETQILLSYIKQKMEASTQNKHQGGKYKHLQMTQEAPKRETQILISNKRWRQAHKINTKEENTNTYK